MCVTLLVLITLGINLLTHDKIKISCFLGLQNVHKIKFVKVMVIITKNG
jgi:hypothetical protein